MKSSLRSARAEWERYIVPVTRGSLALSRSRFFPLIFLRTEEARERFDREARAMSSLSHPSICHLDMWGQQDGTSYLVMEYLEGETLADRLRARDGCRSTRH